jgi:hypothetical protein
MRSFFLRWSVAVVVGSLWGAVVPPARSRIGPSISGLESRSAARQPGTGKLVTTVTTGAIR